MQGSLREREKVTRNLKNKEKNDVLDGYRLYYNFIRPHQSLNGKTPAEIAEIDLELKGNKWLEIIKRAIDERG